VRDAIHILLETKGFLVSEYGSAQDYLLASQEDCVLLVDFSMEELDGLELVKLLRTGGINIPIVLMTDIAGPCDTRRMSAAANCLTVQKPLDSGSLLTAIATCITPEPPEPLSSGL
jgi:two-component system response regulator FixJ